MMNLNLFQTGVAISSMTVWSCIVLAGDSQTIEFNRDIRPILSDTCFHCHGPDSVGRQADLRLDAEQDVLADRGGYSVIVPGNGASSELIARITHADPEQRMPPSDSGRSLSRRDIELLKRWIEQGAKWQKHWSFIPPVRTALPDVKMKNWGQNPIDRFVLSAMERSGLKPSRRAEKTTLIRRVTFDLTGLPPTLQEVNSFLADKSPRAFERVVDRLLESPHYGERMAMHWLDVARYADSHGYSLDRRRVMWPWRDWVIWAYSGNLSFDQFVTQQIAGDLLPNATISQQIATGFNRNHPIQSEGGVINEEYRVETVVDRVETTSAVFLGLTMGCCRCHDHKYDPISQEEFYQFYAFFNNVPESAHVGNTDNEADKPFITVPSLLQDVRRQRIKLQIEQLERRLKAAAKLQPTSGREERIGIDNELPAGAQAFGNGVTDVPESPVASRLSDLKSELASLEASRPTVMVMSEMNPPRKTFVLTRGQYDQPSNIQVAPGLPAVLGQLPDGSTANRLAFAKWLIEPFNPLTARVAVNRYWQMYFGAGLVRTPENFGSQGVRPSHPKLLDWLATEFIRSGWDVKAMQKLIVMSATYQQSSNLTLELLAADPGNRLLARGPRFRLPAELIRDNALSVSGLLVDRLGGPSVRPYQPPGLWDDVVYENVPRFQQDHGDRLYRRSMYTYWKRSVPPPNLQVLDAPSREACVLQRSRTNTPLGALVLMNDPTFMEASRKLAERSIIEGGATTDARLVYMFRLTTGRRPNHQELKRLTRTLAELTADFRRDPNAAKELMRVGESPFRTELNVLEVAAYSAIANALLGLDETITKN